VKRSTRPRYLVAAATASLALGAFGCGDDDDSGALSETEFREQAGGRCETAEQQAVGVQPPGNPAQTARYAAAMRQVLVELRDGMAGLEPPSDLRDPLDRYVTALNEDVAAMEVLEAAAEAGDQARIQRIFSTQIDEDAGQLAVDELGLEACGGAANAVAKTP
jgi:hypothetical protein